MVNPHLIFPPPGQDFQRQLAIAASHLAEPVDCEESVLQITKYSSGLLIYGMFYGFI
jgi:hypothetical protein